MIFYCSICWSEVSAQASSGAAIGATPFVLGWAGALSTKNPFSTPNSCYSQQELSGNPSPSRANQYTNDGVQLNVPNGAQTVCNTLSNAITVGSCVGAAIRSSDDAPIYYLGTLNSYRDAVAMDSETEIAVVPDEYTGNQFLINMGSGSFEFT